MLLRSSSTPVLGSLLSSISDYSPNNRQQSLNKSPFHHYHQVGCQDLTTAAITMNSCNSSPSINDGYCSREGIRRAQSEGNLDRLAFGSCNVSSNGRDDYCQSSTQPRKKVSAGRQKCLMLETIPSFSLCNLKSRFEEEEECDDGDDNGGGFLDEQKRIQMVANSGMVLSEKVGVMERSWNVGFEEERRISGEEMYLARGLGVDGGGSSGGRDGGGGGCGRGGGGGEFHWTGGDGGEMQSTEEYYERMLQENPDNPLFFRNYAQFLYQAKQDLQGAEEYYSRAILVDPADGEILSKYAKLIWELHRDIDKASSHFERAVQASPQDSHVHAAYASFLWETEEDEEEEECNLPGDVNALHGVMASSIG